MPAPSPLPTYLYKILPTAPPSPLPTRLPLSDLDRKDGFIHLSTAEQVPGTAAKYFSEFDHLWLLKLRYEVLEKGTDGDGSVRGKGEGGKIELKWEEVERGFFAHLYGGDLGRENVLEVLRVEKGDGWEGLRLDW